MCNFNLCVIIIYILFCFRVIGGRIFFCFLIGVLFLDVIFIILRWLFWFWRDVLSGSKVVCMFIVMLDVRYGWDVCEWFDIVCWSVFVVIFVMLEGMGGRVMLCFFLKDKWFFVLMEWDVLFVEV